MILVLLLCVVFAIVGLIVSKNNVFSPAVITSVVWLVVFCLFLILDHNLPSLTAKFLMAVSLWIFLFCFGSLFMQSFNFKIEKLQPSDFVRNVFFLISILTFPFFLLYVKEALATGETGNWALDLRFAAIGKTAHFKTAYGGWHILVWNVSFLIELFYFSKKNRFKVLVLFLILLSFGFFTMSKAVFLDLFIKILCVLLFRKRVTLKQLFISISCIILIFIFIQSARQTSVQSNPLDNNSLITLYILGNPVAFDTVEPSSSVHFGENVFRVIYVMADKLGLSAVKPINPILPFIKEPINTNTYTVLYPFFKDFGYWGIGVFALIFGLSSGWIFKRAQQGDVFFVVSYVLLVSAIVMQYGAEMFLTHLPSYFKQFLLLSLPFLSMKYKLFIKKEV